MIDQWKQESLAAFRRELLIWFAGHQRPLPWRKDYNPYHIWISEIMGQQTQMERVSIYFERWIKLFPDIEAVAAAPEQSILKAWEGLGYYSRARNIHRAARQLIAAGRDSIPADHGLLLALPGIGPYTAAAILSIAFNLPYPLVDANVERLFARLADMDTPLKEAAGKKALGCLAERLLDREAPRLFNQALMELGALVCTPKRPDCPSCPVQAYCLALARGQVALRPVPTVRRRRIDITMACVIIRHGSRFFIQQRLPDDVWGGLWEFPGGRLEEDESPAHAAMREVEEETGWRIGEPHFFHTVTHHYMHYRVTLHGFLYVISAPLPEPALTAASHYAWVTLDQMSDFPFPAGHRRLAEKLALAGRSAI